MKALRFPMSPPQTFAVVSLLLIAAMVVVTSITQWSFSRQEIIEGEAMIISDFVDGVIRKELGEDELSALDFERYRDASAREHFEHAFGAPGALSGVLRIKVFDRDKTIVWSDNPELIGTNSTSHERELARAMNGEVRAVFDPADRSLNAVEGIPRMSLIEYYVPLSLVEESGASRTVGVLALYRSPDELNATLRQGLLLLWLVTGSGGVILFAALYKLFKSVYLRQRKAEMQFAHLSTEHERIIQIEKLSAVGQMVSEIAHQLNNPLVGVINLTELAERELKNPQRAKELLGEVRKAGGDCRDFVQRMLRFSEVARSDPKPTDMNELVRETITFFQQSLGGRPDVTLEAADRPLVAKVDPILVRHALFNLIHNAALAQPAGPVTVALAPDARQGVSGCRVTVSDCGPGIKPEIVSKLFTPFFTTRPHGTGLGLSVAQQIVVRHGGSIHGENKPDGGARFTIWLPA